MGAVIRESVADGSLIPLDTFLAAQASIYERGWLPSASTVVTWALRQVGLDALLRGQSSQARYAIVSNIEEAGARLGKLFDQRKGRLERLVPLQSFREEVSQILSLGDSISHEDLAALLVYLSRDKKLISYNKDLVKIRAHGEVKADISAQDAEIASVKDLQVRLSQQEAVLLEKVQSLSDKAKQYVTENNRSGALRALRSRKDCEKVLERRSANLTQVEATLSKIEEAADQVEIVKAMEGSASVLKSLAAETGGLENVERIMDQLQDEMDMVDVIGTVMRENGPGANTVDETEIDDELAALEAESKKHEDATSAEETQHLLENIPSVPALPQEDTEIGDDLRSSVEGLKRMSLDKPAGSEHDEDEQDERAKTAVAAT